ncbi:MAG TPA: multiheme c-type cytochrome [Pirellulales bacterium]|nr:multiheme c-type cytochrome [Pirellulales bacterium]
MFKRLANVAVVLLLLAALAVAADWMITLPADQQARYVGRQACADCHAQQLHGWTGSDHDLAMDMATSETVLGDFSDRQLTHFGITSHMTRDGDKFFITTENAKGEMEKFPIKYTFGVRPLQQYMVEFPGGRVQVLSIAWDTVNKRWFDLHPDERVPPGDELFWAGPQGNWNFMCAECHSTDLRKNYDLATDAYHTTFSEIDVSCEACHGPASTHVELAQRWWPFWDRRHGYGLARLKTASNNAQIDTCAHCHSRRRIVHGDYRPGDSFLDFYQPELIEQPLYTADGQILDEVYEYGSFHESRMYRENVRCSDCHDPHSLKLRLTGNALCLRCHTLAKGNYDSPAHHHHKPDSAGAQCVECHMPTRTYMVVDPRRDHSIRVPRPDLTVKIGTPNACQPCHKKEHETAEWAAAKMNEWYGPKRKAGASFGEAFAAAQGNRPDAEQLLLDVAKPTTTTDKARQAAGIVRATAVALLGRLGGSASRALIEESLHDPDPLVRTSAVDAFDTGGALDEAQQTQLRKLLVPLLDDPVRLVRTEAAKILSHIPISQFTKPQRERYDAVLAELRTGLEATADDAGPHMILGMIDFKHGQFDAAREQYRLAMKLERNPVQAVQARMQLATVERDAGNNAAVEKLYREVIAIRPQFAQAYYDLGLLLAEDEKRLPEVAEMLGQAAKLAPDDARAQYNYGLALQKNGDAARAERALYAAWKLAPASTEYLYALTVLYAQQDDWSNALACAEQLAKMDASYRGFYSQIMRQAQQGR